MLFNFDDSRPDTPRIPQPISRREIVLITVNIHAVLLIAILLGPKLPWVREAIERQQQELAEKARLEQEKQREQARFVFVQPRLDRPAPKPPPRADLSDLDRQARTVERAARPDNPLPFARGNSPERIEAAPPPTRRATPSDAPPQDSEPDTSKPLVTFPESPTAPERSQEARQTEARGPAVGVIADAIRNVRRYAQQDNFGNLRGGQDPQTGEAIQFDSKGVEFGPWLARFVAQVRSNWMIPQAAMSMRGNVVITFNVHKDGRITDVTVARPSTVDAFTLSARNAILTSNPTVPLPPEYPDEKAFFTVTFYFNENRRDDDLADADAANGPLAAPRGAGDPGAGASAHLVSGSPRLVAVVGPTATGKSALGIALAHRFDGEVVSCDSTAVYRGFDIGTDKVPLAERGGVPHHLIDVADPREEYSAARYAREASTVIRDITGRGRLPIVVGGTGLYYRALTRGFFPGPSRDPALRARLDRIAERKGPERLHRWLQRVDPPSALRIERRDQKRLVRALEVYSLTGRPLTAHFADTRSPLPEYRVLPIALQIPPEMTAERVARRVDAQFDQGLLDEVRGLLASGIPETAHPFSGLVYRQALEHLAGVRDQAATRELITRENRRYARRQLIWFRKEPNLQWIYAAGEREDTLEEAVRMIVRLETSADGPDT